MQWKGRLLEGAAGVFGSEAKHDTGEAAVELKSFHAKIGQLTLENNFLEGPLTRAGLLSEKKDRPRAQAVYQASGQGAWISRGTAYCKPRPVSDQGLLLMRKLHELHPKRGPPPGEYIELYNQTRPHSSLNGRTPNHIHFNRRIDSVRS